VDGTSGVSYHGKSRCKFHLDSAKMTFAVNSEDFSIKKLSSEKDRTTHGRVMTICWGLLASIGIIAARYFKASSWWFYVHFFCLSATSILTLISSATTFKEGEISHNFFDDDQISHSRIGHILAALVIGQVVFGLMGWYFTVFTKNTAITMALLKIHRVIGYVMFIAGLMNLDLGWDLNEEGNNGLIVVIYAILFVFFVGFEVFQRVYRNKVRLPSSKLKEISHFEAMEMVKNGKKIMFADELVIDVRHFYRAHPGGSFMIKNNLGEDAGKYMVGCSSYGGSYNPYTHTKKAFSMLKTLAIGKIPEIPGYLSPLYPQSSVYLTFSLKDRLKLNPHTSILYLTSSDFKVSQSCKESSWLGKHFMFKFQKRFKSVQRYYSSIFTDLSSWSPNESSKPINDSSFGDLKFVYKVYPGGKMTNYLDSLKIGDPVTIRGPLGPGLLLHDLSGKFLALAGGTGLVPFIDLVDMAYKKFGNSSDVFKLHLFVFFRTYKDGFGIDNLNEFAKNAKWLELEVVTDENPKKKEIPEIVDGLAKDGFDLAWICGPSGFNRSYKKILRKAGMDKEKIVVM
jgi:NAD(P)H-flavin reductase